MKFADLITRLQNYLKEKPERLKNDISLITDDLHTKFSEYKRIKKQVFRRQVEKAYECIANDNEFVTNLEILIEDKEAETLLNDSNDTIDDHEFNLAIKEDGNFNNQINNMITDIYKQNNPNPTANPAEVTPTKKSNLKASSMFDENNKAVTQEEYDNRKRVKFTNEQAVSQANDLIKKRKLPGDSNESKPKSSRSSQNKPDKLELTMSQTNFESFACDQELKENIFRRIYYILSPADFLSNGKIPPRGFLLHGPPGCGKTQLVYAIAGELNLPLLKITSTELISGVSGESEGNIRDLFDKAISSAPCILFIDEIEAITQRRESASKNMEHRIVTQLLACFDELAVNAYTPIVVIGATNQADSLDIGLRRAGRFDQEIAIGIPDDKHRKQILEILCRKIKLNSDTDMDSIVTNTPGYVGADLNSLIDEALISSLDRRLLNQINSENTDKEGHQFVTSLIDWIKNKLVNLKETTDTTAKSEDSNALQGIEVTQKDFETAIKRVQPSSKREGFATVPNVSWEDIGALSNVREELKTAILAPVKFARQCEIFNFTKPPGILMVGPPGCGKTLLAKAIARESGVNFISVKGPELLNMYVGESERAVRSLFQRARNSKPCVIFFDELDAIVSKRSDGSSGNDGGSSTRVVNQMLTEMDGVESRKGVFLMAASNRPDIIDPAILRPGRLDKIIYVGLPTQNDRCEILKTLTKNGTKPKVDTDVNFEEISKDERAKIFTGADLSALVREASEFALKEFIKNPIAENEIVRLRHFEQAFQKIKPSVSVKDCEKYEKMKAICVNLDN